MMAASMLVAAGKFYILGVHIKKKAVYAEFHHGPSTINDIITVCKYIGYIMN